MHDTMSDYTDSETRLTAFKYIYINFITAVIVANVALLVKYYKKRFRSTLTLAENNDTDLTLTLAENHHDTTRIGFDDAIPSAKGQDGSEILKLEIHLTSIVAVSDATVALSSAVFGIYLASFSSVEDTLSVASGASFAYVFLATIYWSFVSPAIHSLALIARCWMLHFQAYLCHSKSYVPYAFVNFVWIVTFSLITVSSYGCYYIGTVLLGSKTVLTEICLICLPFIAALCAIVNDMWFDVRVCGHCRHAEPSSKSITTCSEICKHQPSHQKLVNNDGLCITAHAPACHDFDGKETVGLFNTRFTWPGSNKTLYSEIAQQQRMTLRAAITNWLLTLPFAIISLCHTTEAVQHSSLLHGIMFDLLMWLVYFRAILLALIYKYE